MRITSLDGDFLELRVVGYQFPSGGDEIVITLTLRGEAAPPSIAPQDRWDRGCAMALRVSRRALTGAAGEWERDLADFPAR